VSAPGADDDVVDAVRAVAGVSSVTRDEDGLVVNCASDAKTAVIGALEDAGVAVDDFHTREASLEDLFLAYTEGDAAERDPDTGASQDGGNDDAPATEEVDR